MSKGWKLSLFVTAALFFMSASADAQFYSGYSYSYQFGPNGYSYQNQWVTPWTSVNVTPYGYVPYPGTAFSPGFPLAPIPRNRYDYGGGYLGRYRQHVR